jgi:predicted ATPase/class 3 adenylate cyclase
VAAQPRGTVTMLFSDIEGSTRLLERLGTDRYSKALDLHRMLLREAFERYRGYEVDYEGDAFFVAFASAEAAVAAASEGQRALAEAAWPEGGEIRVRMGLHTGEPKAAPPKYVGLDVHQAARIMGAAHGGQVLLSEATSRRIDRSELRDLGVHQLKDLSVPQRLYQLEVDDLPKRFPPPRTAGSRPTNLPDFLNPLLGRAEELTELERLLTEGVRLLTLVGTGGAGKTRLSLELARRKPDLYPDGVYFVELAATLDAAAVDSEIAAAIGLLDTSFEALQRYLRSKRLLIVADNLEQIPDAGKPLAKLLAVNTMLTIVATSRIPLRVATERVYEVPELDENTAVQLFAARAAVAEPTFRLKPENEETVRAICRRLEALPLAIELAATRIRLLTPDQLLGRLDSRLALLTSGGRDTPSRHRTLRSTIAWSYELLTPEQQELFARLGTFNGGFTLDAAEHIADASLDDLAALVDGNLIRRRNGRFTMLETIREFAIDELAVLGLDDDARSRHAAYFETLTLEHAESAPSERAARLETGNVRAALDWITAHDASGRRALALTCAVDWDTNVIEGQTRLQALLRTYIVSDAVRAHGLTALSWVAAFMGRTDLVREAASEAIAIYTSIGDAEALASTFDTWDAVRAGCAFAGDIAGTREAIDRMAEAADKLDDIASTVQAQFMLVHFYAWSRDFDAFEELAQRLRDQEHLTRHPEYFATWIAYLEGEVALGRGDPAAATDGFQANLAVVSALDVTHAIGVSLEGVAMALSGSSNPRLGLKLGAAAHALWLRYGYDPEAGGTWNELRQRYFSAAREALGDEADDVWAEGLLTPTAEAVALALGA